MLGGYLEFFMRPAVADLYQIMRSELDDLIQMKVGTKLLEHILFYANVISFLFL